MWLLSASNTSARIVPKFISAWRNAPLAKLQKIHTSLTFINLISNYLCKRKFFVNGTSFTIKSTTVEFLRAPYSTLYFSSYILHVELNIHTTIYTDNATIFAFSWNPVKAIAYIQEHFDKLLEYH